MNKPYVIGIAGGSASGKSTFTKTLCDRVLETGKSALALHMDMYFKPKEERPMGKAPVTGITYLEDNLPVSFNLPKLKADFEVAVKEHAADVIVVEGLLTLWDEELLPFFDLKLFIDCKPDERIVRRLRRNMKERGLSFDEIAGVYLDMVRYRHEEYVEMTKWRADLIINGSTFSEKALDIIISQC